MNPDFWKNPVAPTTLASIAVIVGMIVRILKTKKVGDLLDALPVAWVKRIPKDYLPWIAVVLGMVITMLDAKLNGGLATWREAFWVALAGVLSGSMAVAGNETIGRAVAKRTGKTDPPPAGKDTPDVTIPPTPPSGLSRRMFGYASVAFAAVAILTATPSCAPVLAALPTIIAALIDGMTIIDTIEAWIDRYFKAHPDPAKEVEIANAIQRCRLALNAVVRIAQGADNLNNEKVDAAFEEFKQAYIALIKLAQPYGVRVAPGENGAKLQAKVTAEGNVLEVPSPIAFQKGGK